MCILEMSFSLQVLHNKQMVGAMVESLQEAAAVGMEASELAAGIQTRLDSCRAWDLQAADFFAAPGRAPLSALEVNNTSLLMTHGVCNCHSQVAASTLHDINLVHALRQVVDF